MNSSSKPQHLVYEIKYTYDDNELHQRVIQKSYCETLEDIRSFFDNLIFEFCIIDVSFLPAARQNLKFDIKPVLISHSKYCKTFKISAYGQEVRKDNR